MEALISHNGEFKQVSSLGGTSRAQTWFLSVATQGYSDISSAGQLAGWSIIVPNLVDTDGIAKKKSIRITHLLWIAIGMDGLVIWTPDMRRSSPFPWSSNYTDVKNYT